MVVIGFGEETYGLLGDMPAKRPLVSLQIQSNRALISTFYYLYIIHLFAIKVKCWLGLKKAIEIRIELEKK